MKIEIRADGTLNISGYVNVTEKMSRPVITGKGLKVVEVIEPRAFQNSLDKVDNVAMWKDHEPNYVLSETRAGSLKLYEDAIGLHYETTITDEATISEARAGKLKGLSFGMKNIVDTIENRADALPIRRVSDFDLDHVALIVQKQPCYAATSIEMRANDEVSEIETRSTEESPTITETAPKYDNSEFISRINKLKK